MARNLCHGRRSPPWSRGSDGGVRAPPRGLLGARLRRPVAAQGARRRTRGPDRRGSRTDLTASHCAARCPSEREAVGASSVSVDRRSLFTSLPYLRDNESFALVEIPPAGSLLRRVWRERDVSAQRLRRFSSPP